MRYMNSLRNQWIASRAWMLATLVFIGFSVYLLAVIASLVGKTPVRLVPYQFATANGEVTVTANGLSDQSDYLTRIATADLSNYTTWTPETVVTHTKRFVNRLSPALYAKTGQRLLVKAEARAKSHQVQVLYINHTAVSDNKVRIKGVLRMFQGSTQTKAVKMQYTLTYNGQNGAPMITDFSARQGEEVRNQPNQESAE